MLPEEIHFNRKNSANFKNSHPLKHVPVDDGSVRARLAYDLMTFMQRKECPYFFNPETGSRYQPELSDDEIDIMIVDGYYKEAEALANHRLEEDPNCEKTQFQMAFIRHLKDEYGKLLERENEVLKNEPENVNALLNKGFALANLNREKEALEVTERALHIEPENINVLGNKAYIAKLLGLDTVYEKTLEQAQEVAAKERLEKLKQQEAVQLEDFQALFEETAFVELLTPSAFEEFNNSSGVVTSSQEH